MIDVVIIISSLQAHMNQIYSGFEMLSQKGLINLKYKVDLSRQTGSILKTLINGEIVIFDMADSSSINNHYYEKCDFYIKRMLLKSEYKEKSKLLPYGFNYSVIHNNTYLKYLFFKKCTVQTVKYAIKYHRHLSKVLSVNDSINNASLSLIENSNKLSLPNQILFSARLWDPDRNDELWKKIERKKMNDERIELVRRLKFKYKNQFVGGILDNYLSRRLCPDIIMPKKFTFKENYLKELNKSTIAIATSGLERSIGWKIGEYVSNSCAILSTDISEYQLSGNFDENINYLKFENVDECLMKIGGLIDNTEKRNLLMKNNFRYYSKYIEPAALINNVINHMSNTKPTN